MADEHLATGPADATGSALLLDQGPDAMDAETRSNQRRGDLKRAAGEGWLKVVSTVIDGILSFAMIVVITRGLGPARSGVFFEAVAVMMIGATIAKLGADIGLIRMLSNYVALGRVRDLHRTLLVALIPVLVLGVTIGSLIFFFTPQLAHLLSPHKDTSHLTVPLRALAVFLPLSAVYAVALAGTRGLGTMLPIALVDNVGKSALRLFGALTVILLGFGTVAVAIAWGAPLVVTLVAILLWTRFLMRRARSGGRRGRSPIDLSARSGTASIAREFWRFAAPRAFAAVFATLVRYLDTLLVGNMKGTHAAGIYAATGRYILIGTVALSAMFLVVAPHMSTFLARGDHDRVSSLYRSVTAWLVIPSWPIYLALASFAPFLLSVLGHQFPQGQTVLLILSIAMLVSVATGPVTAVLLMAGHSMWNMLITIVALVLNVGLNLILIPHYGINGAAVAWAVSIVVNNVATLIAVHVLMGLGPMGKGFSIVAFASVLCYGVLGLALRLALGANALSFAVYAVVSTGLYLLILWRFREILDIPILLSALTAKVRSGGRGRRTDG